MESGCYQCLYRPKSCFLRRRRSTGCRWGEALLWIPAVPVLDYHWIKANLHRLPAARGFNTAVPTAEGAGSPGGRHQRRIVRAAANQLLRFQCRELIAYWYIYIDIDIYHSRSERPSSLLMDTEIDPVIDRGKDQCVFTWMCVSDCCYSQCYINNYSAIVYVSVFVVTR